MIKFVGYANYQEAPFFITKIPDNQLQEVLSIPEVTISDLKESDILLSKNMAKNIRDVLFLFLTDQDIENHEWTLE